MSFTNLHGISSGHLRGSPLNLIVRSIFCMLQSHLGLLFSISAVIFPHIICLSMRSILILYPVNCIRWAVAYNVFTNTLMAPVMCNEGNAYPDINLKMWYDLFQTQHHRDDVIKWKHCPRHWPFVRGIHRWAVDSPHKGQWRGALMFCFILSAPE